MKYSKFITLVFATFATVSSFFAQPLRVGMLKYELDTVQKTATVVGSLITGDITIPEQINVKGVKYAVISIGDHAFYKDKLLKDISFPESLKCIGKEAFFGCSALRRLVLPQTLTSIEEGAFAGCTHLQEIYNLRGTPIPIDTTAFDGVNPHKCKLIVHPSSVASYKTTRGWKWFRNVNPLELRW